MPLKIKQMGNVYVLLAMIIGKNKAWYYAGS